MSAAYFVYGVLVVARWLVAIALIALFLSS